MIEVAGSLLQRYGTPCTVVEVETSRNASTGAVTSDTTTHTGLAYRQKAMSAPQPTNPTVSATFIVALADGYRVKPKDTLTHGLYSNQQVLSVQLVEPAQGVAYQLVGV